MNEQQTGSYAPPTARQEWEGGYARALQDWVGVPIQETHLNLQTWTNRPLEITPLGKVIGRFGAALVRWSRRRVR